MTWHAIDCTTRVELESRPGVPERYHLFDEQSVLAINAALAVERPLLVRGEPGLGKTQLAAAAAKVLRRPLVSFTVDSRTEPHDLMWTFDAVRRLAEAQQLCSASGGRDGDVDQLLAERRFVRPGPLWWGFDWKSAQDHLADLKLPPRESDQPAENGRVVLIDEIDKADGSVPNGLLEALGACEFTPVGCPRVTCSEPAPLVIITTNEERVLPDAFVRRCLVLHLKLPKPKDELIEYLVQRGRAHFEDAPADLLEDAAHQLVTDRGRATAPLPGVAEYIDLVRAVVRISRDREVGHKTLLEEMARFTTQKHADGPR